MRAALLVLLAGCVDGASSDPGAGAALQIPDAQFRPGPFPAATGGPAANGVHLRHERVTLGRVDERLDGSLAPSAHAAIVGLEGHDGSWIVVAGPPDTETPDSGALHATFGLAAAIVEPGPFALLVSAVDGAGRIGPATRVDAIAAVERWPAGTLVVGLDWRGRADLDLHVIDPLGNEAYSGDPNTWQPPAPGVPVDPSAYLTGGILDHDGNQGCARDGIPSEHVAWSMPAPAGAYTLRVEARSMCGDAIADWYVAAYADVTGDSDGELIGAARGNAAPPDTQLPHGKGAGVTALTFDLP